MISVGNPLYVIRDALFRANVADVDKCPFFRTLVSLSDSSVSYIHSVIYLSYDFRHAPIHVGFNVSYYVHYICLLAQF